jgi:hypothetical protein
MNETNFPDATSKMKIVNLRNLVSQFQSGILEVASDSFCFLINSSWLLVFIFHLLIFSKLYLVSSYFISFSQLYILLLVFSFIHFHFWFRDLLRELDKKYEVLLIIFFHIICIILVSEGLLFVSFFWTSFHSTIWPGEGFYLPDPCELTFAITLLLFNAAISLGNAFISLESERPHDTHKNQIIM